MTHLADCHPVFARLFAHVHVLFWPWLWLQLRALTRWHFDNGRPDIQVMVTWWGRLRVVAVRDPLPLGAAARPLSLLPRWAAPARASDLPANLSAGTEARLARLQPVAPACLAAAACARPACPDTS